MAYIRLGCMGWQPLATDHQGLVLREVAEVVTSSNDRMQAGHEIILQCEIDPGAQQVGPQ